MWAFTRIWPYSLGNRLWRSEECHICLHVENYCSYALLNARNRKICFLRIGAVYHFFIRHLKLDVLEPPEDEKLPPDLHFGDVYCSTV